MSSSALPGNNDGVEGYDYPAKVRFEIAEQDLPSYLRAADFLSITDVDVVVVEHEFGIFGSPAGSHVLALLRELRMPIVTTLHTVLREPNTEQRRVMRDLIKLSTRLVVMSERGREFLLEVYQAPPAKIDLILHGIPDMPFAAPNFFKDEFGVAGKQVLLTFGLLSPNKRIEFALRALSLSLKCFDQKSKDRLASFSLADQAVQIGEDNFPPYCFNRKYICALVAEMIEGLACKLAVV